MKLQWKNAAARGKIQNASAKCSEFCKSSMLTANLVDACCASCCDMISPSLLEIFKSYAKMKQFMNMS